MKMLQFERFFYIFNLVIFLKAFSACVIYAQATAQRNNTTRQDVVGSLVAAVYQKLSLERCYPDLIPPNLAVICCCSGRYPKCDLIYLFWHKLSCLYRTCV